MTPEEYLIHCLSRGLIEWCDDPVELCVDDLPPLGFYVDESALYGSDYRKSNMTVILACAPHEFVCEVEENGVEYVMSVYNQPMSRVPEAGSGDE